MAEQHVALYVTGSIAAYKALALTRLLIKSGATVRVVMTEAAEAFVTPLSFQILSKNAVVTDMFAGSKVQSVDHIELADWTDLAVVAPATANIIGKLANGIADDMASLTLMATTASKLVVPAMNQHMLDNPATQRNLETLKRDGITVMTPANGFLAEGYNGRGRMPEPAEIMQLISSLKTQTTPLTGKKVIVTAGGTRERIDPVRFITNDSSGKMGYALAEELQHRGAIVTLISAPTKLTVPAGVKLISVLTTEDLAEAVTSAFTQADVLVMAAAVADFKPVNSANQKIKKSADNDQMTIELTKTVDILKQVAKLKRPGQITVGFAAETQNLLENARQKIISKQLDLLIANDVSQPGVGFNGDTNQVTILQTDQAPIKTTLADKHTIAKQVVDQISQRVQKEG
ncbi:bifunctional phosphopantothenoylcysteine decarboxylase/phosphopantothenate--cysteine ligase CoaBC [Lactobacillus sp. LC28-10]|uniref:Coenzyme A biosynthesis bifunctional protein CoaBC n=1 Tax=Secundilactobacillus angelensis TaxID=2722706 RepID=A0ABX1KZ43_9LACO|nr:bifunctional phosphopantothenoylcysteine decarboxylase/phosphopantothenate--cysteine ligase CoaBC [Secundilactobacillus angelensis]MCH5463304.1 bifunctional phosphopantothenoylcysteine decarboxylase/phosphopantothenate--cysteine ligase CoaBC [Secundilactobacillus angelensis]NLR19212.1 bifunctional phosphopantothenoylcysteine decarboxylase/phosphopantothenate--cysteine ligase CoaBC [Secundilactobacillus angelensis]